MLRYINNFTPGASRVKGRNREINPRSVQTQDIDDGGTLSGVGRGQIYELQKGLRL